MNSDQLIINFHPLNSEISSCFSLFLWHFSFGILNFLAFIIMRSDFHKPAALHFDHLPENNESYYVCSINQFITESFRTVSARCERLQSRRLFFLQKKNIVLKKKKKKKKKKNLLN